MKKVFTDVIPHLFFIAGTTAYVAAGQSEFTYKRISKNHQSLYLKQKIPYALNIQGDNNTIHIASGCDLTELRVSGSGNYLIIDSDVTIKHHCIRGSNNTIESDQRISLSERDMNCGNMLLQRLS